MIGVNLIPLEVRRRQALRRRLRGWACVLGPAAALALAPFVTELGRRAEVQTRSADLAGLETRLRNLRREVTASAAAVEEMGAQIARASALRTKRSWAGLLAMIAGCLPEEVWLTTLSTQPGAGDPSARLGRAAPSAEAARPDTPTGEAQAPVVVLEAATRLQLTGFALSHEHLYDLMSRLKTAEAFTFVELVKAGIEPALDAGLDQRRAVKFVLACGW